MADSATIVAASLSDKELRDSVSKLVNYFDDQMKIMAVSTNITVNSIEKKLKSLGNIKIDSGGAADGGSSRRAKLFSQEGEVIQRNNQIAKEYNTTLDQQAAAIRKASQVSVRTGDAGSIRNADTLQTMNIQLDLLRERLREARQQYSSFVAMASSATKTGDKGLYQFATEGVHKYGDEVRTLIPQIRGLQNAIQQMGDVIAPQGHTIQNYVNSLQKANPELAQLNEQFRRGQSELQNQSTSYSTATQSAQRYTEEIRKQAQAIRESQQYQKGERVVIATKQDGTEIVAFSEKRLSLEEQIINAKKAIVEETAKQKKEEEETVQATRLTGEELKKIYQDQKAVNEEINKRANGVRNGGTTPFQSYDSLRQSIASVLGIQEQQVKMANTEKDSYNQLSSTLKQLRQAYDALSKSDRNSDQGKVLVASMHEVERAMQRIKAQAARPVSLESIIGINGKGGLSEKTLDDIAYKMRQLASYRSGLNVETQKKEINTVNQEYDRLKKKMDEVMQKNQSMIASNKALGRSWNYMKNRLAFYFTVGASTQFIKNLIEVRSQYEMNEKALGILLDSASRGTRIFNELSQMSLVSPYTLIELSSAAKQLTAYDIAAKDVVDTTRRLADMASAVGVPVERLTYALGQIKAYGYLNSRDARMFANAGIPLVKQLADYYSELEGKMVSTADVYDRMKKKAIDYNDVMKVVTKMTDEGGKFFDFQAKMADTLKVRLANLTLAWNNMLNELGKSNQGSLNTGIKSLTIVFRHWREIYRVLSTVIVALGAYKAATMLAGITTKSSIGSSAVASWFSLAKGVKSAKDAVALFSLTLKSIPFTAWVTMIATLASYFYLFNNSTDGLKQKLEDIATAFDGVRKEITDLYADALKSDSIGSQLTKLRDMLELAQTELGVTIPIKLEEVNEGNVKQKLKEVKNIIDNYLNFSQEFSEAAAGTKFNELMNEFGANARSTYTGISESINTVVVALQNLVDKGNASKRDLEILNELTSGQKEDESRIEYLQRLVRLYEELGLVGKKVTTPSLSFYSSSTDNMNELAEKQNQQLDRLGIKNKQVFENMLKDVQGYYSSSSIAQYQFEQQVERVAKRIDINNIPEEQRTLKLSAAINEEASLNNWNQFEKEFARQVANERFGTTIEISDESKGVAEQDLKDWQKKQQEWAAKNGITIPINFQTNDTEISYAKRMLQAAKDAKEEVEVQQRKLAVGTGSQDAVDAAKKAYENARILAKNAGADLEQLDKKANAVAKKAAKAAESELAKALKDELSTIDKVRSIYKELTKEGMSHADAVERATRGWKETVNAINKVLQKNGLQKLDLSKFAGIENPRELVNMLQSQLNTLLKRGAKPAEIKELQTKVNTLEVDADKYDLTKITKGLNNELDRLKDEYELAVSLDADPELGGMFADWMGIDINDLPRTAQEYANEASKVLNKELKELGANVELPNLLSITDDDMRAFEQNKTLTQKQLELVKKRVEESRGFYKKEVDDRIKGWNTLLEKYSEYEAKINKIQNDATRERVAFAQQFGSDEERSTALKLQTQILAATDPQEKQKLIQQLQELVKRIAGNDKTKINLVTSINNSEQQGLAKASFEEFQKTPEWLIATGDLSTLTDRALGGLIRRIEEYKKKAKNLDPKQIKNLNNALKNLRKQQRDGNPFLQIANAIDAAKERAAELKPEMDSIMSDIIALEEEIGDNDATEEQANHLETLKQRWKDLAAQGDVSAKEVVGAINSSIAAASQAVSMFTDMADALGGQHMTEATQTIKDVTGVLEKAGQGAAIGAQIGQGWGALIGGVAGGLAGLITTFADKWSGNKAITDSIKDSERAVKRLENAYRELEFAADNAYGTAVAGANQAMKANKELQLVELKRQLALEQSRSSKNRDEDKIIDLTGQIIDLENEISKATSDTLNNLLGISSHGDFFESMISDMISAFKNGEDAMKVFEEKWAEMIDNMIMKTIVSQVLQNWVDSLEDGAQKILDKFTAEPSKAVADLKEQITDLYLQDAGDISEWIYDNDREAFKKILDSLGVTTPNFGNGLLGEGFRSVWFENAWDSGLAQKIADAYKGMLGGRMDTLSKNLDKASLDATGDLIDYYSMAGEDFKANYLDVILERIKENWTFGQDSQKDLSQLQQGIQSMSESTANALEGYMNSVSQQVYYHSTLLEQIRDAIMGTNSDIQLGVQGQMLLQLQQSYQVQMSIQGILEGVLTPSGQGFRVELLS